MYDSIAHELFRPQGIKDFVKEVINNKRKEDISEVYEITQLKKDDSEYWVRIRASAFKDYTGKIIGTIASMSDITESLNSKQAIEASKQELQDLLDNIYDGLIVLDSEGKILEANNSALNLFEIKHNDIGTIRLVDLVHADEKPSVNLNRDKVIANGSLSTFQSKIITPNGRTKIVEVSSSAIIKEGKYVGSQDIIRDITIQKDLERKRELSEAKLQLIIDTALDAVITMNSEGNITEWNKHAEQIFGYTQSDVMGKQLSQFIIP
jgi:PAS domain S-box-containing protein